jgi:hypothetical protein
MTLEKSNFSSRRRDSKIGCGSLVDVGPVSYRKDFRGIFDMSENDSVLANAQAVAPMPFAVHRFHISRSRFTEMGNTLENAERHRPIDSPQLRAGFRRERKAHGLLFTEQLFDHIIVIPAYDRAASVRLRHPSSD